MKIIDNFLMNVLKSRQKSRNFKVLTKFFAALFTMILVYSSIFHVLMAQEGREFSFATGIYWTLTVMSTLGLGDITFQSDIGRIFSMIVLISGTAAILVFMPFTFIEFFYEPWLRSQSDKRVRRSIQLSNHVVLAGDSPISHALIEKLAHYHYNYVLVVPRLEEALSLHDEGFNVVFGELDDPATYQNINIQEASLVVTLNSDFVNTSVVSTIRELTTTVPIISTSRNENTSDILKFVGCTHVLGLSEKVGQALARRTRGDEAVAHVIGRIDKVLIAEANAIDTPLVNQTLTNSRIREISGVTVVGLWERGHFKSVHHETFIGPNAVLVIAASSEQLSKFNELCRKPNKSTSPVIIIGGGRVGRDVAEGLALRGIEYRIIEQKPDRIRDDETYILGDALNMETLEKAGIKEAQTVIISTHDDDVNIYLTIFCRRLRDDIQIINRAHKERNIATLHRVGSDFVISDVALGANTIFNLLKRSDILMVAEGLDVFKVDVPDALAGKTIAESTVRTDTGCNIIAIESKDDTVINPPSDIILEKGMQIILIGSEENENAFLEKYNVGEKEK